MPVVFIVSGSVAVGWTDTLAARTDRSTLLAASVQWTGMSTPRIWLTRANGLTVLRLALAPALAAAVLHGDFVTATVVFWLAVGTDVADGRVARRYGEVSPHGRIIDHAADATFVSIGTAALAWVGEIPVLLSPLIVIAFLEYAIGSRASESRQPRRSRLGHWNGIAYYVAVATPVIRNALDLTWPGVALVQALGWLLVGSTAFSIGDRLVSARASK
jgi:phosphatidylglycerophosphate synthase